MSGYLIELETKDNKRYVIIQTQDKKIKSRNLNASFNYKSLGLLCFGHISITCNGIYLPQK